ncbi:MAG: alanine racemase [Acidobacteriales bacterium]|nr:alanine racemase [Terriglobales bacterium]
MTSRVAESPTIRPLYKGPQPGDRITELDTPTLLVDLDRLEKNIREWQAAISKRGIKFRPHIKTHKVLEIARIQMAAGACGIICAKVSEAEPFAAAGIKDICIAYPVFGEAKWRRTTEIAASGVRITVNCDNETAARGLSRAAARAGVSINVQIDLDTGMHRGGIPAGDLAAIERLARTIMGLPGLQFDGITTFRGLSFDGATSGEEAGHEEGRIMVEVAKRLRNAGLEVREVTAGSTPTGKYAAEVPGITEARAGTYVFNDLMQLAHGAREDEVALSILCTVVSRNHPQRLTVDGGSKTFSGDRPRGSQGGAIARAVDRKIFIERLSEEHGVARVEEDDAQVGEKIRFIPYHVCTCVNLSDQLIGFRGDRVETVWQVAARGLRE